MQQICSSKLFVFDIGRICRLFFELFVVDAIFASRRNAFVLCDVLRPHDNRGAPRPRAHNRAVCNPRADRRRPWWHVGGQISVCLVCRKAICIQNIQSDKRLIEIFSSLNQFAVSLRMLMAASKRRDAILRS